MGWVQVAVHQRRISGKPPGGPYHPGGRAEADRTGVSRGAVQPPPMTATGQLNSPEYTWYFQWIRSGRP
jgi:hypothetical protein